MLFASNNHTNGQPNMQKEITLRKEVRESDIEAVRDIVTSTNFFYDHEIPVAVELVEEAYSKGSESGYEVIFADIDGKPAGYACYGLIPCTKTSYDLYWIVVHNSQRGNGIGKILLNEVTHDVEKMGGSAIYIETSAKEFYRPTQKFYEAAGCTLEATFRDFYDIGDDKRVYVKRIEKTISNKAS